MDLTGLLKQVYIGFGIISVVLIIIWWRLELFRSLFENTDQRKENKGNPQNIMPSQEFMNDEELVAVISAAIAASINTSTNNLRIKSLKRVENWKNVARQESID